MYMKSLLVTVATLTVIFGAPIAVSGHASGISFEQVVGNTRVDIGYDPAGLIEGETHVFDFALLDESSNDIINFDELWVRIVHDERTVLATGLRESAFGRTTLLYVFPYEGDYTTHVSYRTDGATVADAAFPFSVVASSTNTPNLKYVYLLAGGIVGALLAGGALMYRRRLV